MPSARKSSHCLRQGELTMRHYWLMYQTALSKIFWKMSKIFWKTVLFSRRLTVNNLFWNCKVAILVRHFIQLDIDKVRRWDEILSFNKVFNSLSLCFVYLVLFYKPFQTFIIYFTCIVSLCRSDPTPRKIDSWLVLQTLYIYIYTYMLYIPSFIL